MFVLTDCTHCGTKRSLSYLKQHKAGNSISSHL